MFFVRRVHDFLILNTYTTNSLDELNKLDIIPDDLLVGLNQYAAAVENLKSVGMVI